jgi:hypothetical protein
MATWHGNSTCISAALLRRCRLATKRLRRNPIYLVPARSALSRPAARPRTRSSRQYVTNPCVTRRSAGRPCGTTSQRRPCRRKYTAQRQFDGCCSTRADSIRTRVGVIAARRPQRRAEMSFANPRRNPAAGKRRPRVGLTESPAGIHATDHVRRPAAHAAARALATTPRTRSWTEPARTAVTRRTRTTMAAPKPPAETGRTLGAAVPAVRKHHMPLRDEAGRRRVR